MRPYDVHQPAMLAVAHVCPQAYTQRFNPIEGLKHGTIFPELVMAYVPERECPCEPKEADG
ncbi:MAG: spore coat associated protein CotJA [Clostridia bacterium]|nr:spore coat associated protein CotJA [Clostridia bacterium]